jgi:hypothetical protein
MLRAPSLIVHIWHLEASLSLKILELRFRESPEIRGPGLPMAKPFAQPLRGNVMPWTLMELQGRNSCIFQHMSVLIGWLSLVSQCLAQCMPHSKVFICLFFETTSYYVV